MKEIYMIGLAYLITSLEQRKTKFLNSKFLCFLRSKTPVALKTLFNDLVQLHPWLSEHRDK